MNNIEILPTVIVPCYNEEDRLHETTFLKLAESGQLRLLFVDDGSTDLTSAALRRLDASSDAISILTLMRNRGKAEAVRLGLIEASKQGATVLGYFDADLATPADELLRLLSIIESHEDLAAVFGARVAKLGSKIERTYFRHYMGRIYATLASMALGVDVYDTQCGAKVFRANPTFLEAIAQPFASGWAFDVELLDRLLRGTSSSPGISVDAVLEVPLTSWRDIHGSHLGTIDSVRSFLQLISIGIHHRNPDRASTDGESPRRIREELRD
jgi:dolichyl-phosphate beta-glucosyltransferase